jgi:hypothetical protein
MLDEVERWTRFGIWSSNHIIISINNKVAEENMEINRYYYYHHSVRQFRQ